MQVGILLGVSFGSLGCVDCFPLNDCRMCPFALASYFGRNFRTSCSVSPSHVRRFFLIAVINVDVHGLHSTRWRKVHRSDFDYASYKLPAK